MSVIRWELNDRFSRKDNQKSTAQKWVVLFVLKRNR